MSGMTSRTKTATSDGVSTLLLQKHVKTAWTSSTVSCQKLNVQSTQFIDKIMETSHEKGLLQRQLLGGTKLNGSKHRSNDMFY